MIFYNFRKSSFVRAQDAWATVFLFDLVAIPVAIFFSKHLKFLRPDHVTLFSLLSFLVGIVFLFFGFSFLALGMFFVSTVWDCVDGKLARLKGVTSTYGFYVDAVCDAFVHCFGFFAIAVWYVIQVDYLAAAVVFAWSVYFGCLHMDAIYKHALIAEVDSECEAKPGGRWKEVCKRYRLYTNPLSDVEMAFVLIPLSVVLSDFSGVFLITVTFLCLMNKLILFFVKK